MAGVPAVSASNSNAGPKVEGPINLKTSADVAKATATVRTQLSKAQKELAAWVKSGRTDYEITIEPDAMRTRGFQPPAPAPFKKGVHVDQAQLKSVQPNSVMVVTVRSSEQGRVKDSTTLRLQLASDNIMKPGVKLMSAGQIVAKVQNFRANADKMLLP